MVPLWGQRLKRAVPHAVYYEISPSGHCPAHETPGPINALLGHIAEKGDSPFQGMAVGDEIVVDGIRVQLTDGRPRNLFERVDHWLSARRN